MSETTFYHLHLTDDSSEKFQDWRNKMNGPQDSNMVKIDAALGEKANRSTAVHATLRASAWGGTRAPFTQVLDITNLSETQNGIISVSHDATAEQREAARDAMLTVISQASGTLTVAADGEMPDTDIPVYIILLD